MPLHRSIAPGRAGDRGFEPGRQYEPVATAIAIVIAVVMYRKPIVLKTSDGLQEALPLLHLSAMLSPSPARSRSKVKGLNDKVDTLKVEVDAIKAKALRLTRAHLTIVQSISSLCSNYDNAIDRLRDEFQLITDCMETENQELMEKFNTLSDKVGFLMRVIEDTWTPLPPASLASLGLGHT